MTRHGHRVVDDLRGAPPLAFASDDGAEDMRRFLATAGYLHLTGVFGDAFIKIARAAPVPLWWIDGNHEDHARLASAVASDAGPDEDGVIGLGGSLSYVPRGTRVLWDDVAIVLCGGAHSIDRDQPSPLWQACFCCRRGLTTSS